MTPTLSGAASRTGRGTGEKPDLRGPEAGDEGWTPKARAREGRRRHLGGQLGWGTDRVLDANSTKEAMAVPGCGRHVRRQTQTPPWRWSGQSPSQLKQGTEAPWRGCRLRSRRHGGGGWPLLETWLGDQLCTEWGGSSCLALVLRTPRSGMRFQAVDRQSPLSGKGVTTGEAPQGPGWEPTVGDRPELRFPVSFLSTRSPGRTAMPLRNNAAERDRETPRDVSRGSRGRGDPPEPTPTEQERAKQDKPGNGGNTSENHVRKT